MSSNVDEPEINDTQSLYTSWRWFQTKDSFGWDFLEALTCSHHEMVSKRLLRRSVGCHRCSRWWISGLHTWPGHEHHEPGGMAIHKFPATGWSLLCYCGLLSSREKPMGTYWTLGLFQLYLWHHKFQCVHQKNIDPLWLSISFHDSRWILYDFPFSMTSHWFSMTFQWFSSEFPWRSYWFSMTFQWFSSEFPWRSIDFPWRSSDFPRCHFCLPSKGPPNISTSLVLGSTFKTCRWAAGEAETF